MLLGGTTEVAPFPFFGLDVALKRRSSTVLRGTGFGAVNKIKSQTLTDMSHAVRWKMNSTTGCKSKK